MGTRSSSAKNWGYGVTRRMYLNGSTIPTQEPTPDAKLAAMGPNQLASSVRPWFVKASPTLEKAVSCYKADWLVASMRSFRSVQSLLAVRKFRAAWEEHCERGQGQVCMWEPSMLWRPKCIRTIVAIWAQRTYLRFHFGMVGSYTENPEKPQNCQNWEVGTCSGMGAWLGTIRYHQVQNTNSVNSYFVQIAITSLKKKTFFLREYNTHFHSPSFHY